MQWLLLAVSIFISNLGIVNSKGYGKVALNGTEIDKSMYIDTIVTHAGQFECFAPEVNGTRKVLRFDVVLNNFSNDSATFYPYTHPLQLHYSVYDLTAASIAIVGYFNISCIRDTYCYGLDEGNSNEMTTFYYPCVHSGISKNCQQTAPGTGDCRWIDVTNMDFLHVYRILLWLEKPAELTKAKGSVDGAIWATTVSLKNIQRRKEATTVQLVSSIALFGGAPVFAVIFSSCFIHKHRSEWEKHRRRHEAKSDK